MLRFITDEDIEAMIKALLARAKMGNLPAVRELLDRAIGKPISAAEMAKEERFNAELNERIADLMARIQNGSTIRPQENRPD